MSSCVGGNGKEEVEQLLGLPEKAEGHCVQLPCFPLFSYSSSAVPAHTWPKYLEAAAREPRKPCSLRDKLALEGKD